MASRPQCQRFLDWKMSEEEFRFHTSAPRNPLVDLMCAILEQWIEDIQKGDRSNATMRQRAIRNEALAWPRLKHRDFKESVEFIEFGTACEIVGINDIEGFILVASAGRADVVRSYVTTRHQVLALRVKRKRKQWTSIAQDRRQKRRFAASSS